MVWELVKHTLRKMVASWSCEACRAGNGILSKGVQLIESPVGLRKGPTPFMKERTADPPRTSWL